jgi:hypothetical protein
MQPSDRLRNTLLVLYEAMSSSNADAVEAFYSLAPGSVFIGTDASEFWMDSAKHNADVRPFFDGSYGRIEWTPGNVVAMTEGSAGWTVDRPSVRLPDGGVLALRLSFVWHMEDGAWRVVHSHASLGASEA